ncbi:MAG: hypothetical protein LKI24_11140 [Acidipropionibacterium sp.]|nr:hypothetical protein [Acidipropionibacterium sp.]
MSTAMLEAFRSRSLEPLEPYRELIALGATALGPNSADVRRGAPTGPLLDWVRNGGTATAPEYEQLGEQTEDESSRIHAALALVEEWTTNYTEDRELLGAEQWKRPGVTARCQLYSTYEINDQILAALGRIQWFLTNLPGPRRIL